jgi:hypothetical protein
MYKRNKALVAIAQAIALRTNGQFKRVGGTGPPDKVGVQGQSKVTYVKFHRLPA